MKDLILLTGKPRTGESTLFHRLITNYGTDKSIFYVLSTEIRENGNRLGFEVLTSEWLAPVIFAKRGEDGTYRFDPYVGDNIADQVRKNADKIILLDEIGPMQLNCTKFKNTLVELLHVKKFSLIATIALRSEPDGFIEKLKQSPFATLYELSEENRDAVYNNLHQKLEQRLR